MGVPLLKGRYFTKQEELILVLLVSESLAKRYSAESGRSASEAGSPESKDPWATRWALLGT